MQDAATTFEQRVEKTRARFVANLPDRLDELVSTARQTRNTDPRESQIRKVHRLLHDIAGSAAMLDLANIEEPIRKGLCVAEEADMVSAPLEPDQLVQIEAAVSEARAAVARYKG